MESIKEYILSISAAAIICSIITNIVGKKGTNTAVIKLLCGLFVSITIISPWVKLHFSNLTAYMDDMRADSSNAVADGTRLASESTAVIIKERVSAYILDKATSIDLRVKVDVALSTDDPPLPNRITITGSASPYKKKVLQNFIVDNLGIPEENQIWN